ncbi:MAG: DUF3822 family protein [Bacteroidetes bacterium]|nr:MAG: DUF3822 family protein [Bacteroidota bacterium]
MNSPPFTIRTHLPLTLAAGHLPTCRLLLYLQPDRVYYLLQSPREELAACREFHNSSQISPELFLRFVFEKEQLLCGTFLETRVFVSTPLVSLIPDTYRDPEQHLRLSRLLLDDTALPEEVFTRRIPGEEAQALFMASPSLLHLLKHYLRSYTLSHVCIPVLQMARQLGRTNRSLLMLHLTDEALLAVALREGQIRLCSAYTCRSVADQLYFVQMARKISLMEDILAPLFICGESGNDPLSGEIATAFPGLQLPEYLSRSTGADLSAAPYWKYAFLTESSSGTSTTH